MFDFYLKKIKVEGLINSKRLAEQTTRMSGADIADICNKAIINAVIQNRAAANQGDFEAVVEKQFLGIRRKENSSPAELKRRMAVYEAAKAVASLVQKDCEPVFKMTILSRGDLSSQTVTNATEDRLNYNKKELKAMLVMLLAGRVSERLQYSDISTKCSKDYQKAIDVALRYIKTMAMDERFSLISAEPKEMSQQYNSLLEKQAVALIEQLSLQAEELVAKHRQNIDMLAEVLITKETLDRAQIKEVLNLN